MKCSICIATRNKATMLRQTLDSIVSQYPPFEFEVIVCDDGSTDDTPKVLADFPVVALRRERAEYGNPAMARNVAYRAAKGEVLICQSDEVVHLDNDVIERLTVELKPKTFLIATVRNGIARDQLDIYYSGTPHPRPFFFLGSLLRSDLYAVGGNDEEFIEPGFDDNWFADCLIRGLGLQMHIAEDILGWHQHHPRPDTLNDSFQRMGEVYLSKVAKAERGDAEWCSSGGPWCTD